MQTVRKFEEPDALLPSKRTCPAIDNDDCFEISAFEYNPVTNASIYDGFSDVGKEKVKINTKYVSH